MNDNDMNGRLARLEAEVIIMQKDRDMARREHREDMTKLFAKLDELSVKIAQHVPCPAPGACIRIEQDLKEQRVVVEKLEAARNRQLGEKTIIGGIAAVVGSAVSGFIVWLATK